MAGGGLCACTELIRARPAVRKEEPAARRHHVGSSYPACKPLQDNGDDAAEEDQEWDLRQAAARAASQERLRVKQHAMAANGDGGWGEPEPKFRPRVRDEPAVLDAGGLGGGELWAPRSRTASRNHHHAKN